MARNIGNDYRKGAVTGRTQFQHESGAPDYDPQGFRIFGRPASALFPRRRAPTARR